MAEPIDEKIKNDVIRDLVKSSERIRVIIEDEEAREKFKILLEREIDFYSLLEGLESQSTPSDRTQTFDQKVREKLNMSWNDWIKKIANKLNRLLAKLIP